MSDLCAHANVFNTACFVAQKKGWKLELIPAVWTDGEEEPDEPEVYRAIRPDDKGGEWVLVADNPIELLGLIGIYDFVQPTEHKPYWWSALNEKGEDALTWTELLEKAYKEDDDAPGERNDGHDPSSA
jgi:hypothetical protein